MNRETFKAHLLHTMPHFMNIPMPNRIESPKSIIRVPRTTITTGCLICIHVFHCIDNFNSNPSLFRPVVNLRYNINTTTLKTSKHVRIVRSILFYCFSKICCATPCRIINRFYHFSKLRMYFKTYGSNLCPVIFMRCHLLCKRGIVF